MLGSRSILISMAFFTGFLGACLGQEELCPAGLTGCPCSDDGTCVEGSHCDFGICTEPTACIQAYNPCYDYDLDSFTGYCCEGLTCLQVEIDQTSGCVAACTAHSDCATDCCVLAVAGDTFCAPATSVCLDQGKCINTCNWPGDGVCDDGGPNSSYDDCEYGTDCLDCGVRVF